MDLERILAQVGDMDAPGLRNVLRRIDRVNTSSAGSAMPRTSRPVDDRIEFLRQRRAEVGEQRARLRRLTQDLDTDADMSPERSEQINEEIDTMNTRLDRIRSEVENQPSPDRTPIHHASVAEQIQV